MSVIFYFLSSSLAFHDLDREPRSPRSLHLSEACLSVHVLGDLQSPGNLLAEILHLVVAFRPGHVEEGNTLAPALVHSAQQMIEIKFISPVSWDELSQVYPWLSLPV